MYIRGFETQNDIAKFLSRAEDQMTPKEFYNYVLTQQNCDPENFYCAAISIGDMDYVFIVTEHPNKRILYLPGAPSGAVCLMADEITPERRDFLAESQNHATTW